MRMWMGTSRIFSFTIKSQVSFYELVNEIGFNKMSKFKYEANKKFMGFREICF